MANLQTHAHFESIANPNDKALSEKFKAERVDEVSRMAQDRIEAVLDKNNVNKGGLSESFAGRENSSRINVSSFAKDINARVLAITGNVIDDARKAENGSSASKNETNILKYSGKTTLEKVFKIKNSTKLSLTALEVVKESTQKSREKIFNEFSEHKSAQEKALSERGWWNRTAHKLLKVATLGGYALVEKKKRQNYFNNKLEKALTKKFDKLNTEITNAEKEATSNKDRMKKHISRVLSKTHDTTEKEKLIKQATDAMTHSGGIGALSLNEWESLKSGKITSSEEKIAFLEAAKETNEFNDILYAKEESAGKNLKQEEMIKSAKKQQNLIMNSGGYKFKDLRESTDFKDIKPAEKVPQTETLIKNIETQLKGNGINVEKDIYGTHPDIKASDLMTDSARLVLLIRAIEGNNPPGIQTQLKKSIKIRREINAWIDDMDKQTGGGIETHNPKKVKKELKKLNDKKTGILQKFAGFLTKAQDIEKLTKKEVEDLRTDIIAEAAITQTAYETFLNRKGTDNFPKKDFDLIKGIWDKVQSSRKFLLENSKNWVKEIAKRELELSKQDPKTNEHLKLLNQEIGYLNGKKEGSIKFLEEVALKSIGGGAKAKQISAINEQLQNKIDRRDTILEKKKSILDSISLPEFSNLNSIQTHLDEMSVELGIDYSKKISKEVKSSTAIDLNERIQNEFSTKIFQEEMDKKFVKNLATNDQYELLKTISTGTNVKLTYKEVGATKSLEFPNDLEATENNKEFIVFAKDDKVIHLRSKGDNKVISISNAAANNDGTTAYKNAVVRKTANNNSTNFIGGAGEHAIVYNMAIAA